MQPYEIVRRKVIRAGTEWRMAPDTVPDGMRTWTAFVAFVPGDAADIKKRVDALRINFTADVMPDQGGAWVSAGYNDMENILKALR